MTDGALNNYLSAEEEKYFKTGGKNESDIIYDETGEPTDAAPDNSEELPDNDTGATDEPTDLGQDEELDPTEPTPDESEADEDGEAGTETKRDYEKAYKAERHKRKELKETLEAQARKTSEMEATLAQLKQSMMAPPREPAQQVAPKPEPVEIIPDSEVDPIGYQQYEINKLKESNKQLNDYLASQHKTAQQQAAKQAFLQTYKQSAQQFAAQTPDFNDAYNYIVEARTREFVAAGYTKAEADALVVEDEMAIASRAFNDKVNPAQRVYDLAKARGYTNQKAPIKAAPKNLDDVKRGMNNAKSLKSGGGEVGEKSAGMDDIDGMNFKEFDDFWAGYKAKSKGR